MIELINFLPLIKKHVCVLKNNSKWEIWTALFIIMPLALSSLFVSFEVLPQHHFIESSLIVFSILFGFIINIVLLVISKKIQIDLTNLDDLEKKRIRKKINKLKSEILTTSLFCLIEGILILSLLLLMSLIYSEYIRNNFYWRYFSGILYFLIINFILTLFMLIKRIATLIDTIKL